MVDLAAAKTVVKDLVHWENPVGSASTLGFVLACLVSICYYSFISVIAYISLTLLVIVLCIKIYSFAMVFLKKVQLSHFHSSKRARGMRRCVMSQRGDRFAAILREK